MEDILFINDSVVFVYVLDKRAFFLVSTSDVGPQIYELVANSKDEKNKFVEAHLLSFDFFCRSISVWCLIVK